MAGAALYLAAPKLDLAAAQLSGLRSNAGLFRRTATQYSFDLEGRRVLLNVMRPDELPLHLEGLADYVRDLGAGPEAERAALDLVASVKNALGVVTEVELDADGALLPALLLIAQTHDGFLFTMDSIVLANGDILVGPHGIPDESAPPD